MSHPTPLRLVVMGVSGCGKTTLTQALGAALGLRACNLERAAIRTIRYDMV